MIKADKTRKILITGANSFIGNYFKSHLPKSFDVDEVCVKKNTVEDIDFTGYDTVFHVAAIVHQTSQVSNEIYFKVNSKLTIDLAKKAKSQGVKQFVFMSTVKVYGENSSIEKPWKEDTICFPKDAYGQSKLDAEYRLKAIKSDDFIVTIIRTPVVYGIGVKGNIQRMANFISQNYIIPLDQIKNTRAMVYIGNLMALIYTSIENRVGGTLLAGDRRAVSTSEFAKYMINGLDEKRLFLPIPIVVQNIIRVLLPKYYTRLFGSMVISNEKTLNKLDFVPPYKIEPVIKELMQDIKNK